MDLEQEQKTDTQLPKSPQVSIVDNKSKIAMQSSHTLRNVVTYSTVRGQVSTKLKNMATKHSWVIYDDSILSDIC